MSYLYKIVATKTNDRYNLHTITFSMDRENKHQQGGCSRAFIAQVGAKMTQVAEERKC